MNDRESIGWLAFMAIIFCLLLGISFVAGKTTIREANNSGKCEGVCAYLGYDYYDGVGSGNKCTCTKDGKYISANRIEHKNE